MSIELNSAPKGAKALASADPQGKKAGKAADASAGGGFSALMTLLSASEDTALSPVAVASVADEPLTEQDKLGVDVTAAGSGALLLIPPFAAPVPTATLSTATATASSLLSASGSETVIGDAALQVPQADLTSVQASNANASDVPPQLADLALPQPTADPVDLPVKEGKESPLPFAEPNSVPNKFGQHATAADTGALQKLALASTPSDALSVSAAREQTMADVAQTSTVSALLAQKNAVHTQVSSAAQQDVKEAKAFAASQSIVPAADASATLLAGAVGDFVRPQSRFGTRPGFGQSGSSGFDGAFGQAMAATHRSDAVFEVPPASAAVADTAVAETVSYWASQGVQTAELTLDGFGDSPVEVSILLNGDQAQIDFRTDQEGVREVLEAATAQLKELLSSQGLALAGVSVGTSGKGGGTGGERRSRPDAKEITLVKADALGSVATRIANPAVGRSLDLFV